MENRDFLDKPLWEIGFPEGKSVKFTVRHAVEGIQIFGGIGSGKSSGSARTLTKKMLENGFGGLVLTAKVDEKDTWVKYCEETNRLDDLIVIEPGGEHRFNFLEYLSIANSTNDEALTANIVDILKTVINSNNNAAGKRNEDPFWESALDMLLTNTINLCRLAYGTVTVKMMYDVVSSLPKPSYAEAENQGKADLPFFVAFKKALDKVKQQIDDLERYHSRTQNGRKIELSEEEILEIPDARTFKFIDDFFFEALKNLSEKTKSIVIFSFKGFLFDLLQEPTYSLFCKGTSTVTPLDSLKGKIILLNIPVKKYHKVGRSCQVLFKYLWQMEMEKRVIKPDSIALFLISDESQLFLHEKDTEFQATARSSRICTMYISQNLPNYRARMGGNNADDLVLGFLGTLSTKFFHANACHATNKYASDMLGEKYCEKETESSTMTGKDSMSFTKSKSLELQRVIRPEEFSSLLTGGKSNSHLVHAIMHRQGDKLLNNKSYARVAFLQI